MNDRVKLGSTKNGGSPARGKGSHTDEEQGLFPLASLGSGEQAAQGDEVDVELLGYRAPVASEVAGITYRQLDYWARTGIVVPSVRGAVGSGSQRLYSFKDILVLKIVKRLLDTGVSLQNVRLAVDHLHQRGVKELSNVTLFSDGVGVYECTSGEEVVDLLRGGQGVFGIAVGGAMRELSGAVIGMQSFRVDLEEPEPSVEDELSTRRKNKARVS